MPFQPPPPSPADGVSIPGYTSPQPAAQSPWYQVILPYQAAPLLLLLIGLTPVVILTAENLLVPLVEWLPRITTLSPEMLSRSDWMLPWTYWLKLLGMVVLGVLGYGLLFSRLQVIYVTQWSRALARPHLYHTDYMANEQDSFVSLLQWYAYRVLILLAPMFFWGALSVVAMLLVVLFFNLFAGSGGPTQTLCFILASFLFFLMSFIFLWRAGFALWHWLGSLLGSIIAVTEPYLPQEVIWKRSRKLVKKSSSLYLVFAIIVLLGLLNLAGIFFLVESYNIEDVLYGRMNFFLVYWLTGVSAFLWLWGVSLKLSCYHQAMGQYYQELPDVFLKQFTPPPPRVNVSLL